MKPKVVQDFFEKEQVVDHYAVATRRVGLWASEENILTKLFQKDDNLLEIGCGTGRISFGLWDLGYRILTGIDYSKSV